MAIYQCLPSSEENRPVIDFDDPVNMQNDWDYIDAILDSGWDDCDQVLNGEISSIDFPHVEIVVEDVDALKWDVYFSSGRGLYSQRFLDAIGEHSLYGLEPFPAYLNGEVYWYFRCDETLDCLDRTESKFEASSSDPRRVLIIFKAVFRESLIGKDMCFTIPGRENTIYMTEPVVDRLINAKIKGMKLTRDVDINDFKY